MSDTRALIGYPITIKKFIWGFKHFRALRGPGISRTAGEAIFALLLHLSLFEMLKEYEQLAAKHNAPLRFHKYALGFSFFFLIMLIRFGERIQTMPDWISLLAFPLSLVPLILVQSKINHLNKTLRPGIDFATPMTWKNWFGFAIGLLVLLAMLLGAGLLG
ncbi:hypothetical protein KBI23_00975 [bacterium]|nr:hypothetical protein [bacterium]MBP9808921.1 hypothetical protein [bacterium]